MSHSINPHPEWSPRKKPTKRFFKGLVMPAVGHSKGEIPEAFQPKTDANSARFAMICCAMAVLVLSSWIGFVQLRKTLRKRAMQNAVCCGCGQQQGNVSCAKNAVCPKTGTGNPGCRPGQALSPASPGRAPAKSGSAPEKLKP